MKPTPEEIADFHAAIDGVVPLRAKERVRHESPKPRPVPRVQDSGDADLSTSSSTSSSFQGSFEINEEMANVDSFLRVGLARKLLRDLRRGRWPVQGYVDLHGLNRIEAHDSMNQFLAESLAQGWRCVRIVHGRGLGTAERQGVLRQLTKSWLMQYDDVLAFCHAPNFDGGEGALWVLLKLMKNTTR